MKKLDNDIRDIGMTPEFIEKSDLDIRTIKSLNDLAQEREVVFVLSGGYATEAHCGGKVARPHGDIDGRFLLTDSQQVIGLFSIVKAIVEQEKTKWVVIKEDLERFEFLEDAPEKKFFEKRRLEIKTCLKEKYGITLEDGRLIDSAGNVVKAKVDSLIDLVVGKIHKFFVVKDGVDTGKDRHSSASDYFDLKRLMALERLDKEKVRERVSEELDCVLSLFTPWR